MGFSVYLQPDHIVHIRVIRGVFWDNGKENGNYQSILGLHWGSIGIMEKKFETTTIYSGYIGV